MQPLGWGRNAGLRCICLDLPLYADQHIVENSVLEGEYIGGHLTAFLGFMRQMAVDL